MGPRPNPVVAEGQRCGADARGPTMKELGHFVGRPSAWSGLSGATANPAARPSRRGAALGDLGATGVRRTGEKANTTDHHLGD